MSTAELMHFGVKGMRWGVVKKEEQGAGRLRSAKSTAPKTTKTTTSDKTPSEDTIASRKEKAKPYFEKADKARAAVLDIKNKGLDSEVLKKKYPYGNKMSDTQFFFSYGTNKKWAVKNAALEQQALEEKHRKDGMARENGHLTSGQKKAIVYIAGTTALLAAYGALHYKDIMTFRAKPGEIISPRNFTKRYMKGSQKLVKGFTLDEFKKLDDTDIHLDPGTVFERITRHPDEDLSKRLYTTFLKEDGDRYKALYAPTLRARAIMDEGFGAAKTKIYNSKLEVDKAIVAPSTKKRVQLLIDLMGEDLVPDPTNAKVIKGRSLVEEYALNYTDLLKDDVKKMNNEQLGTRMFGIVSRGFVTDTDLTKVYFDKVMKSGYNALMDDNDLGLLSEAPIILLDAKNTVKNRTSTVLTPQMEREAKAKLVELLARH